MLATNDECKDLMASTKADAFKAEQYLLNYETALRQYQDDRLAFMTCKGPDSPGKSNLPGNPTQSQALRGIDFDGTYPGYLWIKAVEIVLRGLDEEKNQFVRLRREAEECKSIIHKTGGRPSWVPYLQCKYAAWMSERYIGREYVPSERTIKAWWRNIIDRVVLVKLKLSEKNSLGLP